jgi:hypothetical protein
MSVSILIYLERSGVNLILKFCALPVKDYLEKVTEFVVLGLKFPDLLRVFLEVIKDPLMLPPLEGIPEGQFLEVIFRKLLLHFNYTIAKE